MAYREVVKYYGFNDSDEPIAALLLMITNPYNNAPIMDLHPSWSVMMLPISYAEAAED